MNLLFSFPGLSEDIETKVIIVIVIVRSMMTRDLARSAAGGSVCTTNLCSLTKLHQIKVLQYNRN